MRPVPSGPGVWRVVPSEGAVSVCGAVHALAGGRLDESARRLSHEELAVARLLAAEGHEVMSLKESRRGGRHPDLSACGRAVEVKSFLPAPERDFRVPTPRGVFNKLADAAGQAPMVVIVGFGSGLTPRVARQGLARYLAERPGTGLESVRMLGDGFDLAWRRQRLRDLGVGRPVPVPGVDRPAGPDGGARAPAGPRPGPSRGIGPHRKPPGPGLSAR